MHNRRAAVYVHSAGHILLLAQSAVIVMCAMILLSQWIGNMEESAILQWKQILYKLFVSSVASKILWTMNNSTMYVDIHYAIPIYIDYV